MNELTLLLPRLQLPVASTLPLLPQPPPVPLLLTAAAARLLLLLLLFHLRTSPSGSGGEKRNEPRRSAAWSRAVSAKMDSPRMAVASL